MNGWLMLWLAMIALGPLGLWLVSEWERNKDVLFDDSLLAFLFVAAMLASSMIGAFGTLGWLIVWMFG